MQPVIRLPPIWNWLLAICLGLTAGAAAWTFTPGANEVDIETDLRKKPTITAQATHFGELLVSPLAFAGSDMVVQPNLPLGPVVAAPSNDVRLLGVARLGAIGRALVRYPDGRTVWIRQGNCVDEVCVTAIGRASAVLVIAGRSEKLNVFDQGRNTASSIASASPAIAPPPERPPTTQEAASPGPGGLEPKSAPPGTVPPI